MVISSFPNEQRMDVRLFTLDPDEAFIDWVPTINLQPLECMNPLQFTRMPIYQEYYVLKNSLVKVVSSCLIVGP
jgi:hypothetical protein